MCVMRFREGNSCDVFGMCATDIVQKVSVAAKLDGFTRVADRSVGNRPTVEIVHKMHGDQIVELVRDAEHNLLGGRFRNFGVWGR